MSVNLDRLIRLAGALRADSASTAWGGWSNAITGLGTDADKSTGWRFTPPRQWTVNELGGLFDGDSIAKRAVSAVVEDGLRGGFELAVNGDTSAGEAWLKKANVAISRAGQVTSFSELVHEILIEARLYGGVLAVPMRESGYPLSPLTPGEPVFSIQWAEPDVAHVLDWFDDPRSPRIGQPWIWGVQLQTGAGASVNAEVHYSRVFPVFGNTSPQRRRHVRSLYRFWPPSVLYPVLEALRLFRSAMAGLGVLLQDFGQGVYLVSDLDQVLTTGDDGATKLAEWMEVRDLLKSAVNAIVLDAGGKDKNPESYSRQSVTLTEVSNLIDRFMALVSEATSTPISRLFGQAPSGLSTDDLSGTRAWYDQCATFRTRRAEPTIRELISACENMEGVGPAPAGYEIEWPSLWQYSPAEESESRLKVAQGDALYLAEGVVTPEAVGRTRAQPDGWRQELPFEPAPEPLIDQMAGEFDPSATPGDRARARRLARRTQRPSRKLDRIASGYARELDEILRRVIWSYRDEIREVVLRHPDVRADSIDDRPFDPVLDRINGALQIRLGSANSLRRIQRRIARVSNLTVRELTDELTIEVPQIRAPGVLANRWLARNQALGRDLASRYVEGVRGVLAKAPVGVRGEDLAREIAAQTGLARWEARRIAVNETLSLHAEINENRQRDLGVTQYIWSSSQDQKVRPWHEDLNESVQSWDDPPLGGGTRADDHGHPGSGILCRCVAVAIVED